LRLQNPDDKKILEPIDAIFPKNVISLKINLDKQYKHEFRGVRSKSNDILKNEELDQFQIDSGKIF